MKQLLYAIPDAIAMLGGMAHSTLYEHIKAGRLHTVKIGRRTYIAAEELERFVATLRDGVSVD
jgi:hypothetical protein